MLLHFEPLQESSRPQVIDYLKRFPPIISEMTFTNLYMWREKRPLRMAVVDESLLFFLESDPLTLFGPPIGPLSLEEAIQKFPITRVERAPTAPQIPGWSFALQPSEADYLYKVSDLVELPGHLFHRQRQLITGALSRYECQCEQVTAQNLEESIRFLENHAVPVEKRASELLMNHFEEWQLQGLLIRIEDRIEAIMVGEPLNPTTFVGHLARVEKTMHGLHSLLDHWFAEKIAIGYDYLNLEQDLGILGLKTAKERLHPDQMILKYTGQADGRPRITETR